MAAFHKTCSKCEAPFVPYRRHGRVCRACRNAQQRERRQSNGDRDTAKYEKTVSGFLMRVYRNMESRVKGVQKIKAHLYVGKHLLGRDEFYTWARNSDVFLDLYTRWKASGYPRRLTPSVDRIDSSKGYTLDNIEWVPFYINCSRGATSPRTKKG